MLREVVQMYLHDVAASSRRIGGDRCFGLAPLGSFAVHLVYLGCGWASSKFGVYIRVAMESVE